MKLTLEECKARMDANGGGLYLSGTGITDTSRVTRLQQGDYAPGRYLYADCILTHVKAKRRVDGYDLYIGKIPGRNVVSDGEHFAHCKTLRDGIADILFKKAADRGAEQYRSLTADSVVTKDEAITMYRIITGACRQGTAHFVESLGDSVKDAYSIREIIDLTSGQYGAARFREFFESGVI